MRFSAHAGLVLAMFFVAAIVPATAGQTSRQAARAAAPGACRTGLATYRIVTKGVGGFTSTVEGQCTFDASAVEGTCVNEYSDTMGQRFRTELVTRHASVADVVDEVMVVPPRQLSLGTTTIVSGSVPASTNTSIIDYDSARRVTSIVAESRPSGQRSTTTFTAWDPAGRPTMAAVVSGRNPATTQRFSYDDGRRTQSMTTNGITCTQTFDENGNPSASSCGNSTTTTTVLTTLRVCKG